jgi:molybdopterin-guanine dinucleotide biosynthesis protein B
LLKVVGVIGYKNSGKTTLTHALARELTSRGHEVAVIKHLSHHLDHPGKDTAVLGEVVSQVGFISPQEAGIFWKKSLGLEDILPYLEADIILVEGFKTKKTFPKIVCLRGEPDDRDLFDGLAICAVGPADQVEGIDVPLLGRNEVGKIADLVEQKAFKISI